MWEWIQKATASKVYKNAKAHNVYHPYLCFICDQTTMPQEHKSLLTTSFPGSLFVGENPGNEVEK